MPPDVSTREKLQKRNVPRCKKRGAETTYAARPRPVGAPLARGSRGCNRLFVRARGWQACYQPRAMQTSKEERVGVTGSAWRDGGGGHTIRWTRFDSPLGRVLLAAT